MKQTFCPIPVADFGKDHWSLLAYLESCVVDPADNRMTEVRGGISQLPAKHAQFNKERLRCNERRHPLHAVNSGISSWQPTYGTRLAGYRRPDGTKEVQRQIPDHDDWDCLNDLEAAGLIELISEANGFFSITDSGIKMAAELRAHKCRGGQFADFVAAS